MRKNNYICNKFKTSNLWDEEEYQMKKNKNDCSRSQSTNLVVFLNQYQQQKKLRN